MTEKLEWDFPPTKRYHRRPRVQIMEPEEPPTRHRVEITVRHHRRPPSWILPAVIIVAVVFLWLPQAALAQNYIHGVLAKFKPQQLAINGCMSAVSEKGAFHSCMLIRGYKFCPECSILGIGGYSCDALLPGSTTNAPCWIPKEAEQPDNSVPQPHPVEKPCDDGKDARCAWDKAAVS